MSPQADYIVANGTGAAVRSDINGQLAAIISNNSGATEPTTMYAYQWWPDTTTGLLKQRNSANNAWVTIGTLASTNLGLLPVAGGAMTGVLAVTAGTAALPGIAVSGDLNTGLFSPGADTLALATGGTQRATLNSSGRLLVGAATSVLDGKLESHFTGSADNGAIFNETANFASTTFLAFALSGTPIGTVGRVGATSAVVYNTTSDYRLKTIVGSVTGQGERIDALKPIDFQWKEGGEQSRGFLAHEFQTVYANSVSGEKDAVNANGNPVYQAMQASTPEVIADLVAEIQQLRARVAALEAA